MNTMNKPTDIYGSFINFYEENTNIARVFSVDILKARANKYMTANHTKLQEEQIREIMEEISISF